MWRHPTASFHIAAQYQQTAFEHFALLFLGVFVTVCAPQWQWWGNRNMPSLCSERTGREVSREATRGVGAYVIPYLPITDNDAFEPLVLYATLFVVRASHITNLQA